MRLVFLWKVQKFSRSTIHSQLVTPPQLLNGIKRPSNIECLAILPNLCRVLRPRFGFDRKDTTITLRNFDRGCGSMILPTIAGLGTVGSNHHLESLAVRLATLAHGP